MAAASAVGAFDLGDDGDAELLSGVPSASIEHVRLQQAKEARHGGVVTGRPDTAHRPDHGMTAQSVDEFPASKFRRPVGVQDAASDLTAAGHGAAEAWVASRDFIRESML